MFRGFAVLNLPRTLQGVMCRTFQKEKGLHVSQEATFSVHPTLKDFKFVPLMFVTLGFGSQILVFRAIFHG